MNDLSHCRVLIVDDVKANVDVLVAALAGEYKLSVALDGESAWRIIEKSPPDLVLLDIVMPGIDGYEVCRRIRANDATSDVPVMFLSSLEDARDKARGFELGGNDYLTKPFEMLEAKARVRSLLKAKAYADAVRNAAERDLRIAHEIQMGILPADIPARATGTGLDVFALLEPAQQVGGDLYEVVRLDRDRLMVAIGDVSGKGIPAALFMAVTSTLLRSMARLSPDPGEILSRVDAELQAQNPRSMFVTMQCLIIDRQRRQVTCASGGHHGAILLRNGQRPQSVFSSSGCMLGIMPGNSFTTETIDLQAGDTLVMYTDGVSEAFDPSQALFGDEALLECLASQYGQSARSIALTVLDAVRTHAGGAKQSDDITLVVVRAGEV